MRTVLNIVAGLGVRKIIQMSSSTTSHHIVGRRSTYLLVPVTSSFPVVGAGTRQLVNVPLLLKIK